MKQVFQDLKTGAIVVAEIATPSVSAGSLLVETHASLLSAGTERMLVSFGRANYLEKARQQPEKVREVLSKVRTDGLMPTIEAIQSKLDQPITMGYSCAGVVLEVGEGVEGFQPGDHVAVNGSHAEIVNVRKNLCVPIPSGVREDEACFGVVGAIALEGVRLLDPTLGECIVVYGMGLIGLIATQLLIANGCRVLGVDLNQDRLELARKFGAETTIANEAFEAASNFSRGRGCDGVLICAGSRSSQIVNEAADICRTRGRVIQVGVTGLDLDRERFFRKEIRFQVSNAAGPGKLEPNFEDRGLDYPIGFVRWTEQRNLEAVLDMIAAGRLDVNALTTHRYALEQADRAYDILHADSTALGIVLEAGISRVNREPTVELDPVTEPANGPELGLIGVGNFASRMLIPAFAKAGLPFGTVASANGVSGQHYGRKYGFKRSTTDVQELLDDDAIGIVAIATRHDSHAALTRRCLDAGKHVFVEKPLAIDRQGLKEVLAATGNPDNVARKVMIGFNRRFAPHVQKMKTLLESVKRSKSILITVNAGSLPNEHWQQDPEVGGGRLIGECCHFVDLARFLVGHPIVDYRASALKANGFIQSDEISVSISFNDGSIASITYVAQGGKSFPKERIEVFVAGRVLQLDNFRVLRGYDWPGFRRMGAWRQDKGHQACIAAFVESVRMGTSAPIDFESIVEVTETTFGLMDQLR